jgi:flagellar biosynthetic protein FliQ
MDPADLASDALRLALTLALPALLASVVISFALSLFELARGHEASLGFVPKLCAVALVLLLCRAWLGRELTAFASELFRGMVVVAR